ncbi:DUF397 domain-containing protein [Streptomyces gobitricini]|uniref:DUF397 domain-containing protein n=1 Tax=Streptomyces gobitricini TaxID=68211 RepID=A0ABN3L8W8_9ACTN
MVSSDRSVPDSNILGGWYKSRHSGGNQGECLEVARGYAGVPVRDSKATNGPALVFSVPGWSTFVDAVKDGHFPG